MPGLFSGFVKAKKKELLGPLHDMDLLTDWKGWKEKYLAVNHWPRVKHFPVQPDLT